MKTKEINEQKVIELLLEGKTLGQISRDHHDEIRLNKRDKKFSVPALGLIKNTAIDRGDLPESMRYQGTKRAKRTVLPPIPDMELTPELALGAIARLLEAKKELEAIKSKQLPELQEALDKYKKGYDNALIVSASLEKELKKYKGYESQFKLAQQQGEIKKGGGGI